MVTKSILLKKVPIKLYKKILNDKVNDGSTLEKVIVGVLNEYYGSK